MTPAVNSWNEWDPLREVIVGSVRGAADMGFEPAFSPYLAKDDPARNFRGAPVPQEAADEAERQIDAFAELLQRQRIVVRRPDPVDQNVAVKTPDWDVERGRAIACPRDTLLVIGDEIIEAPMAQRGRYFEFRAYRTLIKDYFRAGARWTAAPKPLMSDALYDDHTPFDMNEAPLLTEFEPVFDAACFARFGRDIFWQPDLVSNDFGATWLARHLGPDFRIHRITFREKTPTHIDTTLVPIRPGLALTNPQRPCTNDVLDLFRKNDWRLVDAPPSVRSGKSPSREVSNWISMNILMLDERTAVVEAAETPTIDLLKSLDCDVIPCAFDRVYPFGGGLHCATCDVSRDGTLKSYFPSLD
jgi:glycine amidinotransferase